MRFSKLGLDFFTQKDLNWLFKPVANVVRNFMNRKFDILIDLHTGDNLPFRHIVAGSGARFKIGQYDKAYSYLYDFMLSGSERLKKPVKDGIGQGFFPWVTVKAPRLAPDVVGLGEYGDKARYSRWLESAANGVLTPLNAVHWPMWAIRSVSRRIGGLCVQSINGLQAREEWM